MASPDPISHFHDNSSWQYHFARDTCDQIVSIPTGDDLQGYLVRDKEETTFAQVRFLITDVAERRRAYRTVWKNFKNFQAGPDCYIYPEMLDLGESGDIPYYVSALPIGEPIESFLKRIGPILPETAARLVLEFVESLLDHKLRFYKRYGIAPNSVWIEKTSSQPRLVLGEFSPIVHENAEEANTGICLSLLQFLTGSPARNRHFSNLCKEIEEGPQKMHVIANALQTYATKHPPSNFWTDYNQPIPVIQQQASLEVERESAPNLISKLRRTAFSIAACWPVFVCGAAIFLILQTVKLTIFPGDDGYTGLPIFKKEETPPQATRTPTASRSKPSASKRPSATPAPRPRPSAAPGSTTRPSATPASVQRPTVVVQSTGNTGHTQSRPVSQVVNSHQSSSPPPIRIVHRPRPFNVQTVKISGLNSRSDLSLQTKEVIKYLKNRLGSQTSNISTTSPTLGTSDIPIPPTPVRQPQSKNKPKSSSKNNEYQIEKAWQVAQLVELAETSRANLELMPAIRNEVELLKIIPKSSDAKLRLYNDLLLLAHSTDQIDSADDIATLEEASYFHPIAIDLLMKTFRGVANRAM